MAKPSLQDGIDRAGSPMQLLWKVNPQPISVPVVPPEYTNWRDEYIGWRDGAVLLNLTYHMSGSFLRGPDSQKLLRSIGASNVDKFEIGQAKQWIPVTSKGNIVTDTILMRTKANEFLMTGVPCANDWMTYHAEKSGLNVSVEQDPNSGSRPPNQVRPTFRYQVQGKTAMQIIERALGGPAPKVKFFHSEEVKIAGRPVRVFRHGMLGQPGFELLGNWNDKEAVMDALEAAGEGYGLLKVGGLAYYMNAVESGWIPTPTPGIYTDPDLADYRKWLPLYSFEGQMPIHGSYFSENIEDYYVSPYELGYGRLIDFDHDFIGRDALLKAKDTYRRTRVTLVFNAEDVRKVLGQDPGYINRHCRDRVEINGKMAGISMHENYFPVQGTILSLALIDKEHAVPGTQVLVAYGEHPGPGAPAEAHANFPRIRATVEAAPYNAYARTQYRQ